MIERMDPSRAIFQQASLGRTVFSLKTAVSAFIAFAALVLFFASLPGWAEEFQFAWLSDTHIGSSTAADDLLSAVRDINSLPQLKFVIVSGDITEYGSRSQLRLAKEILDNLTIPYHLVPGNHDCKWSESGATDFTRLWGSDRFSFEHAGYRFIGMHQGPVMKMGDGHWAPQDVRWLADTLKHMSDTNQPVFFITHYPVDESIDNWFAVLELLKTRNTQVVLCGHGHANRSLNFEGVAGIMGRSTLRARAPAGAFNIVTIQPERLSVSEHLIGGPTQQPWHTVTLRQRTYLGGTNAFVRPDFAANARYAAVKEKWIFNAGYTIASTPALCKDLAVVGDASGCVHGLTLKTGERRWVFRADGPVYSSPAFSDGRVFFASADGCIYGLNAATGKRLWAFESQLPIVASPLVHKGVVYTGSSEGKFRALDQKNGKLLWEFEGVQGFIEAKALLYRNEVTFGAWDGHFYALDSRTGQLAWKWNGDRAGTLLSPAACWPVAANGRIFIVAPDRKMTALDAETGKEIWRTGDYVVRESIGISQDGSRFYIRAMNDFFFALSTVGDKPTKIWETNAHFGYDINSAALIEKEGTVFYGTKNGVIFALDGKTGNIRWQHRIGTCLVNTVAPVSATAVLAADTDGRVLLLEEKP